MKTPTYTYVTACTRCNGWTEMGGDADHQPEGYSERDGRHRIKRRVLVEDARKTPPCRCPPKPKRERKPKGRSAEELYAAIREQKIGFRFDRDTTPPQILVAKGEPPIFVCAEPAMTLHLYGPDKDGAEAIPANILGPVSRMAIAWHIGATPEEAERVGLTANDAQVELREMVARNLRAAGLPDGPIDDIGPSDPRWGRP